MGIRHYFVEKGNGKAIILLHGNGADSDYFKGQIDEFAKLYHVYALDTRGHGRTPRGEMPFTIRQFADDLLGFMDRICSVFRTARIPRWSSRSGIRSAWTG